MIKRNSGQSMVEFIIVTPVILLLLFGGLQFALIYHAKTALNYAAFEAARFGAVSNARMSEMENAFARGMAAIHTHNPTPDDVMCGREIVYRELEEGFVKIEVLNPPPETDFFNEMAFDGDTIPNDNLMYRDLMSSDGLTIQDANLLKIRTSYCYPMYVPYINRVLGIILTNAPNPNCPGCQGTVTAANSFELGCLRNGRFPIHSQAIVRMQSPAQLSAMTSGMSPWVGDPTFNPGTNKPFFQCGDVSDQTVVETYTPPDTTVRTGYWTLENQSKAGP
jgi:hypothetical protein